MKLSSISTEELKHRIREFARETRESSQVARRLKQLLPLRFLHLSRELKASLKKRVQHHALCDERYLETLQELLDIRYQARRARILYETHLMLFQARQSLRLASLTDRKIWEKDRSPR